MSEIAKKKIVSKKQFSFFGGVALALISIIMIINIGAPARVFSYIFSFLFGATALGIYILIYIIGMVFIFKGSFFKVRFYHIIGLVLLYIGVAVLVSVIINGAYCNYQNFIDVFNNLDGSGKNYITISSVGLYSNSYVIPSMEDVNFAFAGGLVGNGLAGLLISNDNLVIAYLVSIAFLLIGLALILFDLIKYLMSRSRPVKEKPVKEKTPKVKPVRQAEPEPEAPITLSTTSSSRIQNVDPVKNASKLYREPVKQEEPLTRVQPVQPQIQPQPYEVKNPNPSFVSSNSQVSFQTASGFVPARFVRSMDFAQSAPIVNEQANAPVRPAYVEEAQPQVQPQPQIEETPIENRREQLTLDFSETVEEKPQMQPVQPAPRPVVNPVSQVNLTQNQKIVRKPVKWISPSSELLEEADTNEKDEANVRVAEERMQIINDFFHDFNIGASIEGYTIGPSVTRFHVRYNSNVSSRSILNVTNDISIRLGGVAVRFEQVVEGENYSGIEVTNAEKIPVTFKDVYEALPDVKKHPLAIAFGKNVRGDVIWADLNEFPHALLAGTTGSGKSIFINSIITTLIMRNSPDNVKLVLIDPKRIELLRYRDIPHLLCPVVTEPMQAKLVMDKLVQEMNDRYALFEAADGATSVSEYNEYAEENNLEKIPYIVAIVDEFGDLVAATNKEISPSIVLLGQKARACGIHMIIATQRPSVDVITGVIKANLPTHIALCTGSSTESTVILGEGGAEKLLGKGDMLVQSPIVSRSSLVRLQGCFIQKKESARVAGYLKEHYETIYNEKFLNLEEVSKASGNELVNNGSVASSMDAAEEEKYQSVKEWVMCQQYMSMSKIQGDCQVGFNRARRFFNRLQKEGVVGTENEGNKGCKVLIHDPHTEIDTDNIPTSDDQSFVS